MSIIERYLGLVARWRWSLLLGLLLATFVLQALIAKTGFSQLMGFTLFTLIFGGAMYAGKTNAWVSRLVGVILAAAFVVQVLHFLDLVDLQGLLAILALLIVFGALFATFRELLGNRDSTPDSLVGAIFGYFVVAAACAILFRQLEGFHPGSFRLPEGGDIDTQMLYFSIVTITTAGYGDITPATSIAQISAAFEAAFGTFYVAILIGRIVGQLAPGLARTGAQPTEGLSHHGAGSASRPGMPGPS